MKEKVALFYIGQDRYSHISKTNHNKLIEMLNKNYEVVVYDFIQPKLDRTECPYQIGSHKHLKGKSWGGAGKIQVWDFYQASSKIDEQYVVKMRTDIWLTDSAIKSIVDRISDIVNKKLSIAFFGTDEHLGDLNNHNPVYSGKKGKVLDLIIAADKTSITSSTDAFKKFETLKNPGNGNVSFTVLIKNQNSSINSPLKIYLIRKDTSIPSNDRTIVLDWINWFENTIGKTPISENYREWAILQKTDNFK